MCKTKIVATLGPASESRETLTKLIRAGANVVRLNFSHGTAQEHIARANLVREIAAELDTYVGVLVDLQGPIRFVFLVSKMAQFYSIKATYSR